MAFMKVSSGGVLILSIPEGGCASRFRQGHPRGMSLRGANRRSYPRFLCRSMDCFASLAMTAQPGRPIRIRLPSGSPDTLKETELEKLVRTPGAWHGRSADFAA